MISKTADIIRKLLPKNKFARGVTVLAGGTAVAQAIQLLSSPVLTRLYSPDAFGLLAVFASTISLLNIISSLRFECAIPLPESNNDARNLVHLSISVLTFMTLILTLVLFVFGDYLLNKTTLAQLIPYKYFFPIALSFMGVYQIFSFWCVRQKRFLVLGQTEVTRSIATIVVQFLSYLLGAAGLILGHMASSVVGVLPLLKSYRNDWKCYAKRKKIDIKSAINVGLTYRQFPMYSVPNGLLNTAGRELPPIMLATAFSPTAAGFYFLAYRITQKPVHLVTTANAKVFTAHAPEAYRNKQLGRLYSALNAQSLKVFMLPMALAALVSPHLFGIIFGSEWEQAGIIAAILMPWILMIALINPLSPTVGIVNRQGFALNFEIMLAVLRLGGLSVGMFYGSLYLAIALFSTGAVIGLILKMLWLAKIAGANTWLVFVNFVKEIGFVAPFFALGYAILENCSLPASISFLSIMVVFSVTRSFVVFSRGIEYG